LLADAFADSNLHETLRRNFTNDKRNDDEQEYGGYRSEDSDSSDEDLSLFEDFPDFLRMFNFSTKSSFLLLTLLFPQVIQFHSIPPGLQHRMLHSFNFRQLNFFRRLKTRLYRQLMGALQNLSTVLSTQLFLNIKLKIKISHAVTIHYKLGSPKLKLSLHRKSQIYIN
jgi:hypothetical protein